MKKEKEKKEEFSKGFFKKIGYSITKIEKYPELATEGTKKAIIYMSKLVAILAIVLCAGMIYQTSQMVNKGIAYLDKEFPDFNYQESKLTVSSDEPIIIEEENSNFGKMIIDTNLPNEEQLQKYDSLVSEAGSGMIILQDKVILKNQAVTGTITYTYDEIVGQMGITQFTKQDVINYANSTQVVSLYVSVFITIFIYSFIMYFINTIFYGLIISLFGMMTSFITKMKIRYAAIFNMAVYALTLSVILNIVYIGINIWYPFIMSYFEVMYLAVAAIYMIAAVLLTKTEFIKRQGELIKIQEIQEQVKKELEEQEQKKENSEEKKEKEKEKEKEDKKEKKPKEKVEGEIEGEPEGTNA